MPIKYQHFIITPFGVIRGKSEEDPFIRRKLEKMLDYPNSFDCFVRECIKNAPPEIQSQFTSIAPGESFGRWKKEHEYSRFKDSLAEFEKAEKYMEDDF